MNYDYYQDTACEYDEFISQGIYSANPALSSLQEIILIYLRELAYYLLKLKEFGANNEIIKAHIIESISGIITHIDYNPDHFQKLILQLSQDLGQAKVFYAKFCKKNKIESKFLKSPFRTSDNFNITEIIRKGQKYYIKRNTDYDSDQRNLFDIMLFLIKNICIKILKIISFKKDYESAYSSILTMLNTMNHENLTTKQAKKVIEENSQEYHKLIKLVSDTQEELYGQRELVHISFTPKTGKAILVSGIDMTQLEAVLEATKNEGIDVYTHGMTMLMAHTLPKFKKYPNLIGHFGRGSENSLFDFSAFPGAILMTRYLFQKIDYLYKGRLFTTDAFAPSGIIKIKDNNYKPLIQAALAAKGFTKKQQEVIQKVGFKQKVMEEKIIEICNKMEKNEIKHLYFVGLLNSENEYNLYFNKFFSLMPKNCYAISLSHEKIEENVLHVDSFYDYLFIYKILEKFNEKIPLNMLNISIFITKCDQYTITNVINFINMGIKNIFLCKCTPALINPNLIATLKKTYELNEFSTPEEDLAKTLSS